MVITAKDLTDADRDRLNGGVERIIQKSDRDEMLRQLTREISKCVKLQAARDGMKILYVEDNDDNVYMLKNRLSRAGFTVVVATDGAQGVAMAASERPDLILMDLTLPDIDGEEATRRIKADPATQRIPIIALTAHAMPGDREKAIAAGCDDFDTKPVELPRLLGKIRALAPAGERRERRRRRAARRRRHRGQSIRADATARPPGLSERHHRRRRPAGAGAAAIPGRSISCCSTS